MAHRLASVPGLRREVWNVGNEVLYWHIMIQLTTTDMQQLLAPAGFFERDNSKDE